MAPGAFFPMPQTPLTGRLGIWTHVDAEHPDAFVQ
jgi:hypothetical protein